MSLSSSVPRTQTINSDVERHDILISTIDGNATTPAAATAAAVNATFSLLRPYLTDPNPLLLGVDNGDDVWKLIAPAIARRPHLLDTTFAAAVDSSSS